MGCTFALPHLDTVTLPWPTGTDIENGDLCFLGPTLPAMSAITAGSVYPAASMPDQLTSPANQAAFAKSFVGVSHERHLSTDLSSTSPTNENTHDIIPVAVCDVSCASQAWKAGDLVGPVEQLNGTQLESQTITKVTDPAVAIGVCLQDTAGVSVTTIRVVFYSRVFSSPSGESPIRFGALVESVAVANFTDGGGTSGFIDLTGKLPAGAIVQGWDFDCTGAFKADTSAVIEVGVSGTVAKFSADAAQSVFAAGRVGSASLAASSFQATEVSPRITVTGGADFTSIKTDGTGAGTITIYYIATRP